jgi:molybdenum cofactor cytidylyltransferase
METNPFAAVILAAGCSRRLGRTKQLIVHEGQTFIERAVANALVAGCSPVIAVIGHAAHEVGGALARFPAVKVVVNEAWAEGIASSIRAGITFLQKTVPECPGALLLVCDQPALRPTHLKRLLSYAATSPERIAASCYDGGTPGVPAWFPASYFQDLTRLQGDEGARSILRRHMGEAALEPLGIMANDIDTPEDWELLRGRARE